MAKFTGVCKNCHDDVYLDDFEYSDGSPNEWVHKVNDHVLCEEDNDDELKFAEPLPVRIFPVTEAGE